MSRRKEAVKVRKESIGIAVGWQIAGAVLGALGRLIKLIVTTPLLWLPLLFLAALVAVGLRWGQTVMVVTGASTMVLVGAALTGWRLRWPSSFGRWVAGPVRGQCRRILVYRRRWQPAMSITGLSRMVGENEDLPKLVRVRSTAHTDRVRVRLLRGQTMADWALSAERLAQAFDVEQVRIASCPGKRQLIDLVALVEDPLADGAPPIEPDIESELSGADTVDLSAVPIAWTEDRQLFTLPLLGNHILIGGAVGAGKGSVLWSLVKGLGPAVRSGRVRLIGLDPKGGIELGFGRPMFHKLISADPDDAEKTATETLEAFAVALEDAGTIMRARLARMQGNSRLHVPSVEEPLYVIIIDEIAALTAYVDDRKMRERIGAALGILLSQGRAPGCLVVAALQDPRKEVLPQRGLLPIRIGLRLNEANDTTMLLGEGARDRGAACHLIPRSMPGTGYVLVETQPEAARIRFPWISDPDVIQLAQQYAPRGTLPDLHLVAS
ncbi:FtsK/SpoIIIE domain-containing protein [Microlunatus speluncae]|uniref:FtsK/SpoIIIE domain-containing protein n=1 Tax=Microlunatus speluncae TaxID=2594267 RepID=UPI001266149C|nr:FtsK/SpoIIIE domain-containing protein [Microlunatus speluncae]